MGGNMGRLGLAIFFCVLTCGFPEISARIAFVASCIEQEYPTGPNWFTCEVSGAAEFVAEDDQEKIKSVAIFLRVDLETEAFEEILDDFLCNKEYFRDEYKVCKNYPDLFEREKDDYDIKTKIKILRDVNVYEVPPVQLEPITFDEGSSQYGYILNSATVSEEPSEYWTAPIPVEILQYCGLDAFGFMILLSIFFYLETLLPWDWL